MATRDTPWPAGTPCWIDLTVTDFDEAAEFYSTLFGWSVTPGGSEMGRYAIATMDDRPVAGLAPQMDPNQALPGWITYLATDDVDATARKIHDAGGSVLMDPMDVLDEGRIALALDPGGALFGLWQARRHIGFGLFNVPGSVVWNENLSTEWELNKTFYGAVFDYSFGVIPSDEFQYATIALTDGGRPVGGIGGVPTEPAVWRTTFQVADADQTIAQVKQLGGTVVEPLKDTTYGRMATVTDSQGHTFSIGQVSEQG